MSPVLSIVTKKERTVEEAIAAYTTLLKPNSVRNYMIEWNRFQNWLGQQPVASVDSVLAAEYMKSLGIVKVNPWKPIFISLRGARSGEVRPHRAVPLDDIRSRLLALIPATREGFRNRVLILLLFGAGMRVSEVLDLTLRDFYEDDDAYVLKLRNTKVRHAQEQVLPPEVAVDVKKFFHARLFRDGAGMTDPAFVHVAGKKRAGTPLSYHFVLRLLTHLGHESGLGKLTCHDGRASMITEALSQGLSPLEVAEISRHKSIEMVMLYNKRRSGHRDHPAKKLFFGKKLLPE